MVRNPKQAWAVAFTMVWPCVFTLRIKKGVCIGNEMILVLQSRMFFSTVPWQVINEDDNEDDNENDNGDG